MAITLDGVVSGPTGYLNGAQVDAWLASRFTSIPAAGDGPPGGLPDAGPVLSGTNFGGPGQWRLDVPSVNAYYVRVTYPVGSTNAKSYWAYDNSLVLTQGNQGAQGAQGYQGNQGPQGSQGFQGAQGVQGSTGSQGPQGYQGNQGFTGAQGSQGTQGVQGTQGLVGPQGFTGPQGTQGNQGAPSTVPGPQGYQGSQGPQGFSGPQGSTGSQGPQGFQGTQGATGAQGAQGVQGTQGSQGFQGTQGVQGIQGPQGFQGLTGNTGPQGTQGVQGATGSQGAQGPQGFQGYQGYQGAASTVQGPQGFQGYQGYQGVIGQTGPQGPQGFVGSQGSQGFPGPQGFTGATGSQGPQGSQGSQGNQGFIGNPGAQGFQGPQGFQGTQGNQGAAAALSGNMTGNISGTGSYRLTNLVGAQSVTDSARADSVPGYLAPSVHGPVAWSYDVSQSSNSLALTLGVQYFMSVTIPYGFTPSNYYFACPATNAGTCTSFVIGIYNTSGTLLTSATPTNYATQINAGNASMVKVAITSSVALTAGTYVIGFVASGGTTGPTLYANSQSIGALNNIGCPTPSAGKLDQRACTAGTGLTSLANPMSATPAVANRIFFVGLS